MGNYRHVIWDWNGTLLDDAWLCVEVLNGLLARRRRSQTRSRILCEGIASARRSRNALIKWARRP